MKLTLSFWAEIQIKSSKSTEDLFFSLLSDAELTFFFPFWIHRTNYFYAGEELYTVNGGLHHVPGAAVFDDFHTYTIDWSPDRIQWLVDDQLIRVREKSETCQADGVCKYPSSPS
jgi:hypothetical protein